MYVYVYFLLYSESTHLYINKYLLKENVYFSKVVNFHVASSIIILPHIDNCLLYCMLNFSPFYLRLQDGKVAFLVIYNSNICYMAIKTHNFYVIL